MKIFIYKFIVIYIIYFFGKNLFYIYHIFIKKKYLTHINLEPKNNLFI